MEIKTCKECGRMFNSYTMSVTLCPVCTRKLEEKFKVVKDYIRDNKDENIATVAKECDVPLKAIHKWIREGRLIMSGGEDFELTCESCGEPIETGRWCKTCQKKMMNELSDVSAAMGDSLKQQREKEEAKKASSYMRSRKN